MCARKGVLLAVVIATAVFLAPGASWAVLISYVGNTDSNNRATIDVTYAGSATSGTLSLVLDNTSPLFTPIITGIAFDVPSGLTNLTAGTLPSGWGFLFDPGNINTPQAVGDFDACSDVSPTDTNCNGGNPNFGLTPGGGTFLLTLNATGTGLSQTAFVNAFNDFGESAVRFQNTGLLGQGSDVATPTTTPPPPSVPEPATLTLIGSGLVGVALMSRRFRKR
jgi:hypothetical protein